MQHARRLNCNIKVYLWHISPLSSASLKSQETRYDSLEDNVTSVLKERVNEAEERAQVAPWPRLTNFRGSSLINRTKGKVHYTTYIDARLNVTIDVSLWYMRLIYIYGFMNLYSMYVQPRTPFLGLNCFSHYRRVGEYVWSLPRFSLIDKMRRGRLPSLSLFLLRSRRGV